MASSSRRAASARPCAACARRAGSWARGTSQRATCARCGRLGRRRRCGCACTPLPLSAPLQTLTHSRALRRRDPAVKRTLCKRCDALLVPGVTASVRVNGQSLLAPRSPHPRSMLTVLAIESKYHRHAVSTTCLHCRTCRRIPAPPVPDVDAAPEAGPSAPDAMAVDETPAAPQPLRRRDRKAHPLPLFQRDVGHVVFRGNEQYHAG
jgi:RNase P subunit RPR2